MPVIALHHVQLAMPKGREKEARAFYAGILGFEEVPKPANLVKRGGVWFASGPVNLHLGIDEDFRPAKKAHPAFVVEDLPSLLKRCKAADYIILATDEPLEGYDRAYVADPFGNRIELLQALSLPS
jgi:catechol 2,3-dioxygenase-like lactoylglutathione lyase family enzyme